MWQEGYLPGRSDDLLQPSDLSHPLPLSSNPPLPSSSSSLILIPSQRPFRPSDIFRPPTSSEAKETPPGGFSDLVLDGRGRPGWGGRWIGWGDVAQKVGHRLFHTQTKSTQDPQSQRESEPSE